MRLPAFCEYRVINFQDRVSLVAVHPEDATRLHWNGGITYMFGEAGKHYTLLKVYQVADFPDEDAIEIQFYLDFPVEAEMPPKEQSPGWLSPEGVFYPCEVALHESTAICLSAMYYRSLAASGILERKGWLRIMDDGFIRWLDGCEYQLTQRQADTLGALLAVSKGKFQTRLNGTLSYCVIVE